MSRFFAVLGVLLSSELTLPQAQTAGQTSPRMVTVFEPTSYRPSFSGVKRVVVSSFAGNLRVRVAPSSTPVVRVVRYGLRRDALRDLTISLNRQGTDYVVQARDVSTSLVARDTYGVNIDITVPSPLEVKLQTGEGSLEVQGASGQVYLRGKQGNVLVSDLRDAVVDAELARGAVLARRVDFRAGGTSRFVTGFGDITLSAPRLTGRAEITCNASSGTVQAVLKGFQFVENILRRDGSGTPTRVSLSSGLGRISVSN